MKIGADTTVTYTISVDAIAASTTADALSLVRIDAHADWHERHRFLKWEIPTRIVTQSASFETQFGHIERPTIRNTSWVRRSIVSNADRAGPRSIRGGWTQIRRRVRIWVRRRPPQRLQIRCAMVLTKLR